LLRIDYGGGHKNPETVIETVPEYLIPFAGKIFTYDEPHIHLYVEGYKSHMDWAMPLQQNDFPVKSITNSTDIIDAFYEFNMRIFIKTSFTIEMSAV